MNATVALQMAGADLLKLRKKRGTMIWSVILAIAPLVVFFAVGAVQHSSNPLKHAPAGGLRGYSDALRVLAMFFGPLAAIMIGTESGAGDAATGTLRDLIITGRSRMALFASRVPAALLLCWLAVIGGYVVVVIASYALADGTPSPDVTLLLNGLGFSLLSTGVVCVIATGFASLIASRPAALTVLIGWHLVASPVLANITSLGGARAAILSQAIGHFSPVGLDDGGPRGPAVTMSGETAFFVLAAWVAVFLALGAWRARRMDA